MNVQPEVRPLKFYYPKLTVICGIEHTVLSFFNDVSKIPILHQIISDHKMIYNIFGSDIYHKPNPTFKSKYQYFHNKNIVVFSVNDTIMSGYFMGMHRDLSIENFIQYTILSAEFIGIPKDNVFLQSS